MTAETTRTTYHDLPARPVPAALFTEESTYRHTRLPVDRASTLLPDAYTSPEFFALERERVFAAGWVPVGFTADVDRPGACVVVDVAGRSVIVTRDRSGGLRAFHNVCRHRAARLLDAGARELGRRGRIRCPYHSWTYDSDGSCLGTPLFEGSDVPDGQQPVFDTSGATAFDRADHGLLPVAVDTWGFLLFVNLVPDPAPLAEHLGDLPQRFADHGLHRWIPQRRRTYDVAANHKLIAENFMEYYHLPWVHPELSRVSKFSDHYRWQGPGMYTGMCTTPVSRNTDAGGWDGLVALDTLGPDDADSGRFVWLFPSCALVVLPNHAFVLLNRPVAADRTVETAVLLTHPAALEAPGAQEGLDRLTEFWDLVNRQDLEIVERVQEGIANPAYRGGRMCYRFEEPLHRFQNMVVDRMVGVDRVPGGDAGTATRMFPDPA
ncbi:aromatic ring-hydroxylating oxygenase subunit alpha [Pseudonocardia oceani]|uniref:Aromatic ring-hydroxylating dioxygenase subunit alpha n=3 Tax=Pseudonocardia oceani TaxID=2792013 RepID=A0ABS6UG54_9PSEU|nr:aromatic ring-hydroxylating dioxygenase subunit alpha [Pseudonocardia oceani]MBW0122719.1 aromatic ring-hydroxylating dioxygenase subunit alpha [Pseudonocardia oceani]MBW0130844.1 aromatic ring-hydroxylating dioxygenase subunit alpha [Pseudonocardia oceani]